jgi:zinc D-Ala-D-Ala dipeptidase
MVMKLSINPFLPISLILIIALQSCGLTGNNASKMAPALVIVNDKDIYTSETQVDSNNQMVSLTNYLHPFIRDFRYATQQNFTKKVLYNHPEGFLRLPAAKALRAVEEELKEQNLSLKLFDAYRPYSITVEMWKIVPDERYAANPAKGSGHNRGIAVDLTLVNLQTGQELQMPTGFDDFSEKAHHNYMQLDSAVIANRHLLRTVMEKHGFAALETEWWHYSLPDPKKYSLLDFNFDQLRKLTRNN